MTLLTRPKKTVATIVVATDGTGDTTDIQTGINLLPAGGGVVYIKKGTYTITATITINSNNVAIKGAGQATQIQTALNIALFRAINFNHISFEDLYIYGDGTSGSRGITLNNVEDFYMSGCYVENCGYGLFADNDCPRLILMKNHYVNNFLSGIALVWVYNSIIIANTSTGNTEHGLHLDGSDNVIINANQFNSNTGYGVNYHMLPGPSCERVILTNNQIYNNTTGAIFGLAANEQRAHNITV